MKIKEIAKLEQNNSGAIYLIKEGLFCRAYELSAYYFVTHIKEYQLTKKFFKNINSQIVYLGFPANALEGVLKNVEGKNIEQNDGLISITQFEQNKEKFDTWKMAIKELAIKNNEIKIETSPNKENEIIGRIRNFPIAVKSPIECQQFIAELQNQING